MGTIDPGAAEGRTLIDHVYSLDGERVYVTSTIEDEEGTHDHIAIYASGSLDPLGPELELRQADGSEPAWPPRVGLAGFSDDGSTLYGLAGFDRSSGGSALLWIDSEQLTVKRVLFRTSESQVKAMALSPDRTRLAIGSADGRVRIWDLIAAELGDEISLGDAYPGQQVQGVAWRDDDQLEVALSSALVVGLTTDVDRLLEAVAGSLSRGFSTTECATYGIDPCPSVSAGEQPAGD